MRKCLSMVLALVAALLVAACGGGHALSAHPPGWGKPAPVSVRHSVVNVPTGSMFDTITLASLPHGPFALAGYTSGHWPTYLPLRRAFAKAHTISIAVSASFHADCLDVEPGDATPAQAPGWVKADIAAGFKRPCIYSSFWMFVNQVRPLLAKAGIARSSVFEWDADYTSVPHIDASFDATQWTDRALGRNLDESMVELRFLSIASPPYVAPRPPKPRPKPKPKPPVHPPRKPDAVCGRLAARQSWFAAQLRKHPRVKAAKRRRALAATDRALTAHYCK